LIKGRKFGNEQCTGFNGFNGGILKDEKRGVREDG